MVLVAKVFEVKEGMDIQTMAGKLKGYKEEQPYEGEAGKDKLTTEILDLKMEDGSIVGIFSRDFVLSRYYKRGLVETLVTEEVPFWIAPHEDRTFLIVLAPSKARGVKKLLTNFVASKLGEILFIKPGPVVETKITHGTLKKLHESNPQATKLIWFDNVDYPGVGKLALAGSGLADTKIYKEYLEHGKLWYIVYEIKKRGLVVGITRNSVVTLFSRSTLNEFVNFVIEDIIPIIA